MTERAVVSELNARVWTLDVAVGDAVEADDTLMMLEAMKTEIPVTAPCAGTVRAVLVAEGDLVAEGQKLLMLEA